MVEFLTFTLLGLGVGGGYALAAQGMVVIYRGSGVINLAQGAIAGVGAFAYYVFTSNAGLPGIVAVALATLLCAILGLLIHVAIMRPLRRASGLIRLIATAGIMTVLSQILLLRYGASFVLMQPLFPRTPIHFTNALTISEDRIWLLGIAVVITTVLTLAYRWTRWGIATSAVAESEEVVAAHGWRPGQLAAINWVVGCALAGFAGALLGPIVFLTPTTSTLMVMSLLATALLGRFRSFPLAFAGGLSIGIGQSLLTAYVSQPGWSDALPFLVVVVVLVVRGSSLPLRSHVLERLPRVGTPRVKIRTAVLIGLIGVLVAQLLSDNWANSASTTFAFATVALSVVVITGFCGQLSLAQYAIAGVGALVASRIVAVAGVSFFVGVLCAVVVSVLVGIIVSLPALRVRGVNLAISTLGLAIVVQEVVLGNATLTGGVGGTNVKPPSVFGFSLDPITHPQRYAALCIVGFVICAVLVRNLRRGPAGRRMVAVRGNERAAAAMGISVTSAKIYGFAFGAALAAVGGALLAFQDTSITYGNFTALASIQLVVFVVIGGIGFIGSSIQGALMSVGGLVAIAIGEVIPFGEYVVLVGGISVILVLVTNPDGVIPPMIRQFHRLLRSTHVEEYLVDASVLPPRVAPKKLVVSELGARFGGIQALDGVSFEVAPGEVVGMIGPNGAGKTTCIDVISGFTRGSGNVKLGDRDLARLPASHRAREGLGRSFQSLELLEDVSVWENLATASEITRPRAWGLDLVWPRAAELSPAASAAVTTFGLEPYLSRLPSELSSGTRRIVAIARAVAVAPSVLLLDEPAAGLDEQESRELGELLVSVAHEWGIGVLLVDHDVDLVMRVCDRCVVLDYGRTIASGEPSEIVNDLAVVEAYLGRPNSDDGQIQCETTMVIPEVQRS